MHYDVHYSRHDRMFNAVENKYSNVMGKTHDDSFSQTDVCNLRHRQFNTTYTCNCTCN